LPPLEKALLIFSSYEIIFQKDVPIPLLIDQAVIFSKKYLEEEKYKYINKALDLISKEK
jgi:N utilization substance protein B